MPAFVVSFYSIFYCFFKIFRCSNCSLLGPKWSIPIQAQPIQRRHRSYPCDEPNPPFNLANAEVDQTATIFGAGADHAAGSGAVADAGVAFAAFVVGVTAADLLLPVLHDD